MPHEVLVPAELDPDPSLHVARPNGSRRPLLCARRGRRSLATPWQVSAERAALLNPDRLPVGAVLDVACGSGVQLAALAAILERPAIGVELDPSRARASAQNLHAVASWFGALEAPWFLQSRILVGDGTDAKGVLEAVGHAPVGLLQLDPARPRNSRTHDLDEMAPSPNTVLQAWANHLALGPDGPAVLLDLSPRLTHDQRLAMEAVIDAHCPGIQRTWVWGSRGGARGPPFSVAWRGFFTRSGPALRALSRRPVPSRSSSRVVVRSPLVKTCQRSCDVRRAEVSTWSLMDAALLASGLAEAWLFGHGARGCALLDSGRRPSSSGPP